jgi:Peptidase M50B-like
MLGDVSRTLQGALHEFVALQAHLPVGSSVLLGVAALGAATLPGISLVTQHFNTMAHEGAHAAMGSATGRRITSVAMRGNGEGRTSMTKPEGAGFLLAGIVGYLGPSAFGLGAAWMIQAGHVVAVLWVFLLALACLAVMVRRNGFGLATVLVTGIVIFLVARYAPLGAQIAVAYGIAWFLLVSGLRVVLQHGRHASDAVVLRELTRLPRSVWAGLWLIGSAAALLLGGHWLV